MDYSPLMIFLAFALVAVIAAYISGAICYRNGNATGWNEGYSAALDAEEVRWREHNRSLWKLAAHHGVATEEVPAPEVTLSIHPSHQKQQRTS